MVVGHWGADLDFYDRIKNKEKEADNENGDKASTRESATASHPFVFIATGKEQRDQRTLIEAFNRTGLPLKLYIGINPDSSVPNPNLDAVRSYKPAANIDVREICGLLPYEIALDVAKAQCVAICCKHTRYTAGLTTVVEALGLGLPMVCSRNPQIPIDIDSEGCGISVEYGDVEGWQRAISYLASHPDEARRMGEKGRQIAEERFNDRQCAREVAAVLKEAVAQSKRLYIPIKLVNLVLAIIAAVLLVLCINTLRGIN